MVVGLFVDHVDRSTSGEVTGLSSRLDGFDSHTVCHEKSMDGWQSGNASDCKSDTPWGTGGSNPSPSTSFQINAGVAQWQSRSLPNLGREFESLYPLQFQCIPS